jgi:hypothetical protein
MDRWMEASDLNGPWTAVQDPPTMLQKVREKFANDPQVDMLNDLSEDLKEALEDGIVPTIYVSTVPAELIVTQGEPQLEPIPGTNLLWVKNTTNILLLDSVEQFYYVLLSGRWFRSKSLEKGSWEYVPANKLPADFAKIPETHPRGDALASVAGTPQAREAVIANDVPQTATIKRSEAKLETFYDGAPQFQPIQDTDLSYAVNTPTPVVQVSPDSYFACENGVWFTATAPTGPWAAALVVPEVIYTIPPSSPIYYVTYVYTYGFTPEYVYVGYYPGYFGTCLSPEDVVVFGTGWSFTGWVGTYWFGAFWTYGWGAYCCWTDAGWGLGFGVCCGRPWWGPIGWHTHSIAKWWRHGWERGWGGSYANVHINHINFNNFNVYHRWGDHVYVNAIHKSDAARGAEGASHLLKNGEIGRRTLNNILAGRDGHVYRRELNGWARHDAQGWHRIEPARSAPEGRTDPLSQRLNREWTARRVGDARHNTFRAATRTQVWRPPYVTQPSVVGPAGARPPAPPTAVARPPALPTPVAPHYVGPQNRVGGPAGFRGGPGGFRNSVAVHHR